MKRDRRYIAALLLASFLFALTGCSAAKVDDALGIVSNAVEELRELESTPEPTRTPETPPPSTPEPTPEPTATPEPTPTPVPVPTPRSDIYLTGTAQADYLRYAPLCDTPDDELRDRFVAQAQSGLSLSYTTADDVSQIISGVVFGEEANTNFMLTCADASGLTDLGVFNVLPECDMQYHYLTEVNGFGCCPLTDCAPFGGSFLAEPGDLVFWLDESGTAVNFAVVVSASHSYFCLVLSRADGSTASFDVNWANLGRKCTNQGVLVHLIYPAAEQMVYYFLKKELSYSTAAACGVMANIYKESNYRLSARSNGSYGLCQWLGERRSGLVTWCAQNGLDSAALSGQLKYLQHELYQEKYLELHFYLVDMDDTAEAAYEAAREWCFQYEQPGDIANVARDRALIARDELYPIYSQYSD